VERLPRLRLAQKMTSFMKRHRFLNIKLLTRPAHLHINDGETLEDLGIAFSSSRVLTSVAEPSLQVIAEG